MSRERERGIVIAVLAVFVILAAGFAAWRFWPAKPPVPPPAPLQATVAVLPFVRGDWPQGLRSALAAFQQVTEKAPRFADGFAWYAIAAEDLALNYDAAPALGYAIAQESALKALALDPRNVRAREILGYVALDTWNWRAAAPNFRILRNQTPNNLSTFIGLWNYYDLLGFPNEALAQWRHLFAIDPGAYRDSSQTIWALVDTGRFPEEIGVVLGQLVHRPNDTDRLHWLCEAYSATGQIGDARAVEQRLRGQQTTPDSQK